MVTLGDAMRGRAIDPKLQSKQFGFKISGFPEGNPHLNRETQQEAGILGKETYLPYHPEFEEQTKNPLTQHGTPHFRDDDHEADGERTVEQAEAMGVSSAVLRERPGRPAWQKPDPQQRLFDIDSVPRAQAHEQTPDQWLRRDDVMFHTGPQPGEPFKTNTYTGTHFGTAEAGIVLYGSSQGRDVVARRIPGVHDYPTALDQGEGFWGVDGVQYENKVEDMGSVSVHEQPEHTRSWVDDQRSGGRFSDYADQMEGIAASRQLPVNEWGEYADGEVDTSFRFRSMESNRASMARRGQTLKPPPSHFQDFLADEESLQWGPRPTEWRHQWDKMKNWKMKP